jgi:ubiquinone/menaquinone biosynthesis C-methylase UbiE
VGKHVHSGCTKKSFENPKEILVAAGVGKDGVLLDIGSGSGYFSVAASEISGAGGMVYALDAHGESVEALSKELSGRNLTNVKTILADAAKVIPLDRESVDTCLMSNVVHGFVANREMVRVLSNVNEVLKDKGKLIVIDFKNIETPYGPPLSIRLSPEEVEHVVEPFGYDLIKQINVGPDHYGLVFEKHSLQGKCC